MRKEVIEKVRNEMQRVQRAASDVLFHSEKSEDGKTFYGGKHTAALRRASMDLTRALSELRRHT